MNEIKFLNRPDSLHPFLVVNKASGVPSAPLFEGDFSVLTLALNAFPEIKNVHGKKEIEHGLIHRIDTETSGLVLIALTQNFYDFMIGEQSENRFEKFYRAQVDFLPDISEKLAGFPATPFLIEETESAVKNHKFLTVESEFRKFGKGGKEVRPILENGGKAAKKKSSGKMYRTQIKFLDENHAEAKITQGFRHQVRCHLAWIGFPVHGDAVYNPEARDTGKQKMWFEACKIKFRNPITKEIEVFEI